MPTEKASSKKKNPAPVRAAGKVGRVVKSPAKTKPVTKAAPKAAAKPIAKSSPKSAKKPVEKPVPASKTKPVSVPTKSAKVAKPVVEKAVVEQSAPKAITDAAAPKKKSAAVQHDSSAEMKAREKKYAELFGISQPKGKGVNLQGEAARAEDVSAEGWCVVQYPPRPGRLTWIYATHGLSTVCAKGKDCPTRIELAMHWRERGTLPISILTETVKYILESGHLLAPGDIISETEGIRVGINDLMLKRIIALHPEPFMPRTLELPGGDVRPVMLLGISEAEMESATKVRPELADGRKVLMDALRAGGVFPVTDPKRQCLTRRRDFLRIWETAFRGVREKK